LAGFFSVLDFFIVVAFFVAVVVFVAVAFLVTLVAVAVFVAAAFFVTLVAAAVFVSAFAAALDFVVGATAGFAGCDVTLEDVLVPVAADVAFLGGMLLMCDA
jgi:hypothetical protein